MIDLETIEQLTHAYATAHDELARVVGDLQEQIDETKSEAMPDIRVAALRAKRAYQQLHATLARAEAAALFVKPRTRTFDGFKVGLQKQKGKVMIDDEAKVIARIREQLPKDQVELLLRITESVHKPAVYDLTAGDLKRLGIRVCDDEDAPVIKSVDSDVDKLVKAYVDASDVAAVAV